MPINATQPYGMGARIVRMHNVSAEVLDAPAHVESCNDVPVPCALTGSASSPAALARLRRGDSFGARMRDLCSRRASPIARRKTCR
jgi:hypothetical protein